MTSVKCYHVKHRLNLTLLLENAKKVADYAVENKNNRKVLTSKYVKQFGLPSAISNQILRKYGRGTIKEAKNVNLIIPNSSNRTYNMKDMDHKISRKIVTYAHKHKLKIVVEDLKGIRTNARKGNGLKNINRFVNSWSFYRLQSFIEYKAKELGIPFEKIKPHYTSQECSYCSVIGKRDGDTFVCKNEKCKSYKKKRQSYINAAFNIGKRSLSPN